MSRAALQRPLRAATFVHVWTLQMGSMSSPAPDI